MPDLSTGAPGSPVTLMVHSPLGKTPRTSIAERLKRVDWERVESRLRDDGFARIPRLLSAGECAALSALYPLDDRFRKRIDMERHRFGVGEYKYFDRPLPPLVRDLRTHAYPYLAVIANRWMTALGAAAAFPARLRGLQELCRRAGQTKPTPLLLRYTTAGYNCLHQDLYGEIAFPLQLTCLLSRPGVDYRGGEFLLVEQRPRAQSVGQAVVLSRGEAIIFPTRFRPIAGKRGHFRATVRHGVSRLSSGSRTTLGVIFHDAR
jgi:hypothetical protein